MIIAKPYLEILDNSDYKKSIELAARICYKSEDKICEGSADKMIEMLVKNEHGAMLEHGTIYLDFPGEALYSDLKFSKYNRYVTNEYSFAKRGDFGDLLVTTNYRVLVENDWLEDMDYICCPTAKHEKRHSVRFITSIGIVRELLRHRVFSFANESTRYCNYSKDKFDSMVTFIEPYWLGDDREFKNSEAYDNCFERFVSACEEAEGAYFDLLDEGFKPQQAREVLPLCTKSELIMTGFDSDWKQMIALRTAPTAHPDMINLLEPLKDLKWLEC